MSDIEERLEDLLVFSEMCAPKYNTPELSDRVLVFDVMQDDWETASILGSVSGTTEVTEPSSEMPASVCLTATNDKRSLETEEEPKLKRVKITSTEHKLQAMNFFKTEAQHKSGGFQELACEQAAEYETKRTAELVCDQGENKQVDYLSSSEGVTESPLSSNQDLLTVNPKTYKHEPLRQYAIYIHSLWLAVQSPYFRSLLHSSGMKETQDREVHLKIPESEENAHLTLLQAMYNAEVLNNKTVDELLPVLELADKYDVKFVFKICKYVLLENATTFEICSQIMHVIKVKHNMSDVEDLVTTLQLVLAKEFSPLDENWQSEKFENLSEPSVKYLLSSDDLIVQSENTVFHALMYWMEQNEIDPAGLEKTNDLLAVVRFGLVTTDYLYNVVKNHPTASKIPKFNELFLNGMIYHAVSPEQKKLLKVPPVLRKKPDGKIIQFTFVVKKQVYESSQQTRTKLQSEKFWACGYKMRVVFVWESIFLFPGLRVYNLNEESLVCLKFAVFGQNASNHPNWVTGTFSSNIRKVCRMKNSCNVDSCLFKLSDGTRVFDVAVEAF